MRRRFEVKREMRDAGSIRPGDADNQKNYMTPELQAELERVGFEDDYEVDFEEDIEQSNRELSLDENGCPVLPQGWTFLTHGSSIDRWNPDLLGNDFVVGDGIANGQNVSRRPLCCVERRMAKYDYDRYGSNTARAYGGKQQAFEIRVLYYDNPRTGYGKIVREKLSPEQISEINKCYMYQGGRHPAIPAGTKLSFLTNGDFDEITNTNGNNILWYIPEQYLEAYLEDAEKMQNISKDEIVFENKTTVSEKVVSKSAKVLTNADVEQELKEFYSDDISIPEIEAYLAQKIQAVYGDKLQKAGIADVRRVLNGKLENFEGASSYIEIVEELEGVIEAAEKYKNVSYEADIEDYERVKPEMEEDKEKELSPLLQGITGCKTVEEKNIRMAKAREEYLISKSEPDIVRLADKGIDR